jgi:hypothetical protein
MRTVGPPPWILVAWLAWSGCGARTSLVGPGDEDVPPAVDVAGPDVPVSCAVSPAVDGRGWSACVNITPCYGSCAELCAYIGRSCAATCTTSRGYPGWAAEAWWAGQACGGEGAGQQTCAFRWDGTLGDPPRWRCCCR